MAYLGCNYGFYCGRDYRDPMYVPEYEDDVVAVYDPEDDNEED